jgi:RNA-binding protein YlmH
MQCVTFVYRKEDKLTHRDILGSLMAQQMKREVVGDIVAEEGIAQTFLTDVAAKLITGSVSKIGRVGVKTETGRPFELENAQKFQDISGTVASLRLDCIVSLAAKLSREKAAALIRTDKVDVNHLTADSLSHELKEGDILSIRGCGRFILSGINGETKKGRIHIILKKYI